ncbi:MULTISPECIES: DUF1127 domain-containing protein [unclassified Ruegeria]|jgi:uncharacterized protein YjiS (DUF1127 family)|uniref:DUF1127 domain-containing protein n=1 Tax=unclassified Ruegeria TaxID=2625375 RepID=UPI000D55AC3D|nr:MULTISPECIES: DUF1127 domain-containing protein [unclassified Ruegeria]
MAHTATYSRDGFGLSARIANFFERVKEANALRAQYDQTYSELQSLTDRELDDIGVRRCDIKDIARDHVYCS